MTAYSSPSLRGVIAGAAAFVVAAALLVAAPVTASASTSAVASGGVAVTVQTASGSPSVDSSIRKTADMSQFRPGNIISDAVFFDRSTMDAGQIQAFLNSKVGVCRSSYACLKTYSQHTPNKAADAYCNGYSAGLSELASTIIAKVAQSCGINPQVLLTILEKEQSLVTSAYPDAGRFTKAMGHACPDTAACDPAFAGFFHQVYGAARQFKIYAEGKWFTYYAPGRTWNILYNPNHACGSAPVYVENTATAALYYYTPYQPNRAALNNQYGLGDGCSAYGNRNFFRIFTDWFGSTQGKRLSLVRASNSNEVYLVSAGSKHYVTNPSDLSALSVRLGALQVVSPEYLAAVPTGNRVIRLIRDGRNGAMYLLQPDGTKHHFASAGLISRYGMRVEDYLPLSPEHIDAFPTGTPVGDFFRSEDSPDYFRWENGQRRHIANGLAWQQQRAAAGDYVAVFPAGNAAYPPRGRAILAPGTLVKESSRDEVYIVGTGTELMHIPTWELSADAGITAYQPVPDGTFSGYKTVTGLAPFVVCGNENLVTDGGRMGRLATAPPGVQMPRLPDSICAVLPRSNATIAAPLFIKSKTADPIYELRDGKLRHVQSGARLLELNGGRFPYTVTWSSQTIAAYPKGAPHLAENAFVSFGDEKIYVMRGGQLRHVTTQQQLIALAGPVWPIPVAKLDASFFGAYQVGAPLP
ncbi:hypothetical protein [Microbacterium sp. CR_7]|uniref:hypothetical protein n=1 Tax=Microbacterium sp. CR_7 TaxID=3055792 RepID=UPI0035C1DA0F